MGKGKEEQEGYGMEGMKERGRRKVRGIEDGRNGK